MVNQKELCFGNTKEWGINNMQQYTIDGKIEEVNLEDSNKTIKRRILSIKQRFRAMYGINKNVICKDCKYCIRENYNNKHYYKCKIMGISSSPATDIRLKDYGCSKWEKKENV